MLTSITMRMENFCFSLTHHTIEYAFFIVFANVSVVPKKTATGGVRCSMLFSAMSHISAVTLIAGNLDRLNSEFSKN